MAVKPKYLGSAHTYSHIWADSFLTLFLLLAFVCLLFWVCFVFLLFVFIDFVGLFLISVCSHCIFIKLSEPVPNCHQISLYFLLFVSFRRLLAWGLVSYSSLQSSCQHLCHSHLILITHHQLSLLPIQLHWCIICSKVSPLLLPLSHFYLSFYLRTENVHAYITAFILHDIVWWRIQHSLRYHFNMFNTKSPYWDCGVKWHTRKETGWV